MLEETEIEQDQKKTMPMEWSGYSARSAFSKRQDNSWVSFLRDPHTKGRTMIEKSGAYSELKGELAQSFREANPFVQRYIAGLRKRLHENRVKYTKECHIEEDTLAFFETFARMSIPGTTLTFCQMVGLQLLKKCVPRIEAKFYTFSKVLGVGLHGFVFECRYQIREPYAVKLMLLHDREDWYSMSTGKTMVYSVSRESLSREVSMQRRMSAMGQTSSCFRTLEIVGDLAVFEPRRFDRKLGVYIMQKLPVPTLNTEINLFQKDPSETRRPTLGKMLVLGAQDSRAAAQGKEGLAQ